jgi:hypothetical protein
MPDLSKNPPLSVVLADLYEQAGRMRPEGWQFCIEKSNIEGEEEEIYSSCAAGYEFDQDYQVPRWWLDCWKPGIRTCFP